MNPNTITTIVRETLRRMDVPEPAMEMLIKGTFAVESGFEELIEFDSYGFALMKEKEIEFVFDEILQYNNRFKTLVERAALVDVNTITKEEFVFAVKTNIAMMIVVLYLFYMNQYDEMPEYDLDSVARTYARYFVKASDLSYEDDFKNAYREYFG